MRLPFHDVPVVQWFLRGLVEKGPALARRAVPILSRPAFARVLLRLARMQDPEQAIALGALLRNTASPTVLSGGRKVNIIPSSAGVLVDGRMLPGRPSTTSSPRCSASSALTCG